MIVLILYILIVIYKHFKYDEAYSEINIYMALVNVLKDSHIFVVNTTTMHKDYFIKDILNNKDIFHKLSYRMSLKRKFHFVESDIIIDDIIKLTINNTCVYFSIKSYYNSPIYVIGYIYTIS